MQKLNTAAQMRQMDYTAMHGKYGIQPAVLMENAGHAIAERADEYIHGWAGKLPAISQRPEPGLTCTSWDKPKNTVMNRSSI